jgi:hypothetical protein
MKEKNNENTMWFLKEAFCIDGEVKLIGKSVVNTGNGNLDSSLTYELTDSKRGTFFITLSQ